MALILERIVLGSTTGLSAAPGMAGISTCAHPSRRCNPLFVLLEEPEVAATREHLVEAAHQVSKLRYKEVHLLEACLEGVGSPVDELLVPGWPGPQSSPEGWAGNELCT